MLLRQSALWQSRYVTNVYFPQQLPTSDRSNQVASVLRSSTSFKGNATSLTLIKSPFTAMCDGEPLIVCSKGRSSFARCVTPPLGGALVIKLRQPIQLFVATADQRFGPVTTIRSNGRIEKHIPWSAFTFSDDDWNRVSEAADLLAVCPYFIRTRLYTDIVSGLEQNSTGLFGRETPHSLASPPVDRGVTNCMGEEKGRPAFCQISQINL